MFSRTSFIFLILFLIGFSQPVCSQDSLNVTMLHSEMVNWGSVRDIKIYRDYVFIGCAETGIKILDFSDPTNVVEVGRLEKHSYFIEIDEENHLLFSMKELTPSQSRFIAYNIENLDFIYPTGAGTIYHYSKGISVSDDILLSRTMDQYFTLSDVSNPPEMNVFASIMVPESIREAIIRNGYAYVLTPWHLFVYDCTASPYNRIVYQEELNEFCNTACMDVEGDYLYIYEDKSLPENNSEMKIFNISNPASPIRLATIPVNSWPLSLKIQDNYAFAICRTHEIASDRFIEFYDVSNPRNPVYLYQLDDNFVRKLWVNEDFLILRHNESTIDFMDYGNINNLINVHSFSYDGEIKELAVYNDKAFLADEDGGLVAYDILDHTNPEILVQFHFDGFKPTTIQMKDGLIYASSTNELKILDFTNLENPEEVFVINDDTNQINSFEIFGDFLYLMTNGNIKIFDMTDPYSLNEISNVEVTGKVIDAAKIGNYVYVYSTFRILSYNFYYFSVIDISDPLNPVRLLEREDMPSITSMTTDGQYLYCGTAACAGANFLIYDVSTPELPTLINDIFTRPGITNITLNENRAYITTYNDGMIIINIEDINDLSVEGYYSTPGHGQDIEIYDGHIIVGDLFYLDILEFNNSNSRQELPSNLIPDHFEVSPVYPNPFNSSVRFNVSVPSTTELHIRIFNLLGKEVANLNPGTVSVGVHSYSWNVDLATGIYFLEVSNGSGWHHLRKMVFQK